MKRTPPLTKKRKPRKSAKPLPDTRILEALCSVLLAELTHRHGSDLMEMYGAVYDMETASGCREANSDLKAFIRRIHDSVKYQYENHWGKPAPTDFNKTNCSELTDTEWRGLPP